MVGERKVHQNVSAMIVPGSGLVKAQAEAEGLDKILKRRASTGVSRLLDVPGHEPGQAAAGERCASTSNRNFEAARVRAAARISSPPRWRRRRRAGRFVDIREWPNA